MNNYTSKLIQQAFFYNNNFSFSSFDQQKRTVCFHLKEELNHFKKTPLEFLLLDDFIQVSGIIYEVIKLKDFDQNDEVKLFEEDLYKIFNNLKTSLRHLKHIKNIKPIINVSLNDSNDKDENYIHVSYTFIIMIKLDIHSNVLLESILNKYVKYLIQSYSFLFNERFIDNKDLDIYLKAFFAIETNSYIQDHFNKDWVQKFDKNMFNDEFLKYISFKNDSEYQDSINLLKINYQY